MNILPRAIYRQYTMLLREVMAVAAFTLLVHTRRTKAARMRRVMLGVEGSCRSAQNIFNNKQDTNKEEIL